MPISPKRLAVGMALLTSLLIGHSVPGQTGEIVNLKLVDVTSFGAFGDSITDDRQAVLNAIASIGGDGGTLYFPPGHWYRLSDNIVINKDNVTVLGYGASVYCNSKTTTGGVFGFLGTKTKRLVGGGVYGLTVYCKPDSNVTQNENALFAVYSKNVTFRDCHVPYANRKGIVDHHSLGTQVLYNRIDSAGFAGISMEFGAALPDSGGHQQIIGNTVGAIFRRDVGPLQQPNIVNDSIWEGSGISVSSIAAAYGLVDAPVIRDNHIGYAAKAGIYAHLTSDAVITGNIVDSARYGIVIMRSVRPTVSDNTIFAADSVGIWLRDPVDSGNIRSNRIVTVMSSLGTPVRTTGKR